MLLKKNNCEYIYPHNWAFWFTECIFVLFLVFAIYALVEVLSTSDESALLYGFFPSLLIAIGGIILSIIMIVEIMMQELVIFTSDGYIVNKNKTSMVFSSYKIYCKDIISYKKVKKYLLPCLEFTLKNNKHFYLPYTMFTKKQIFYIIEKIKLFGGLS